jgi:glycosyltransferase involved in cell wall biosynthesis
VSPPRTVTFIQEWLPRYRLPFFDLLRDLLSTQRIELRLYYGQPAGAVAKRSDAAGLPWAHQVVNAHLGPLVWQPVWRQARRADLVIVEQANRLALNYLLLAARSASGPRVAFFGHGANLQRNPASLRERWKRMSVRTPDWWFAYTDGVASRVVSAGYPPNRITVVQNAVDTSRLAGVDIPKRAGRCIYVGSLYESKRLPFLLDAADSIAVDVPRFELIVVGDGPLRPWLQGEAEIRPWLHQEGPSHGVQRDRLFASSELTLVPGSVGLVVVDSFAARAPLVTVHEASHGPEIEYLQEGVNGRVIELESVKNYASAVTQLLVDRALREKLAEGCARSSKKYTVGAMATNFASGIAAALDMPPRSRCSTLGHIEPGPGHGHGL